MSEANQSQSPLTETVESENIGQPSVRQIRLVGPGKGQETVETVTVELDAHLARSAALNEFYEREYGLSFSGMLLGFLASVSSSFWSRLGEVKLNFQALLERRKLSREVFEKIAATPVEAIRRDEYRPTSSARSYFEEARRLLAETNRTKILDVRHLLAVYIYRPGGHAEELASIGLDRADWSKNFVGAMAQLYPAELPGWRKLHEQTFPGVPLPELSSVPPVPEKATPPLAGPSTHIATDIWTIEDALGYRAYAYAIYKFMTHPRTRPPLTISIQAPWGGGKSSLMRMIQHELDPDPFTHDSLSASPEPLSLGRIAREIKSIAAAAGTTRVSAGTRTNSTADRPRRFTVWFNAWKYENTNQVWAGLVDSVMQQVTARMSIADRELFYLQLNLKRINPEKLRARIHEQLLKSWWRLVRWTFISVASVALVGLAAGLNWFSAASGAAGLLTAAVQFLIARRKVDGEPAAFSLREFLDQPDYNAELGFVHRVEADVRRLLACVPKTHLPLVIFIDDLDRCSPAKVAQVVEAINLFLAGDFPDCMFVLGMDTEMVAAALQAAHKEMIANLPEDAGIPVGWRFMDKFVQLPFLIPPPEPYDLAQYTTSLFLQGQTPPQDDAMIKVIAEESVRVSTLEDINQAVEESKKDHSYTDEQAALLRAQLTRVVEEKHVDRSIAAFNDENVEIRKLIESQSDSFRGNPRELKRFVNAFRFQYFLWSARTALGQLAPSQEQVVRWTVLSMKWPEVVRWLRRGTAFELGEHSQPLGGSVETRLRLITNLIGNSNSEGEWRQQAEKELGLDPKRTLWLGDSDLYSFFKREHRLVQNQQLCLADGAGLGLW